MSATSDTLGSTGLTPVQREKLQQVMEMLMVPEDLAIDLLRRCDWNAERAVESYIDMDASAGSNTGNAGFSGGGGGGGGYDMNNSNSSSNSNSNSNSNYGNGSFAEHAHPPARSNSSLRRRDNNSNSNINNNSNSNRSNVNNSSNSDAGILERVARGIFRPFEWLFQTRQMVVDPEADAVAFRTSFLNEYNGGSHLIRNGSSPPANLQIFEGSHKKACVNAFQTHRHLLVYLHAPIHQDTDAFCNSVIFSPQFARMLSDNNVVFWVGSLWNAEAYLLSEHMGVSSYPFLGLLICHSNTTAQLLDKVQGVTNQEQIIGRLTNYIIGSAHLIQNMRQRQEDRTQSVNLRAVQDREYAEAEERARRSRMQKEKEDKEAKLKSEREMEEKKQREYEQQQAEELEKAIAMSKQLSFESEIEQRRDRLGNEPGGDIPASSVATIRFQTPVGAKLIRKFLKTDKVERLYDYMLCYFNDQKQEGALKMRNILISINVPKQDLQDMSASIESVGLYPRGAVFVQDLDS